MAGCPRERDRTQSSDENSQHHIGVLVQDAPLGAGVNVTAFGGRPPDTLTPVPWWRALSCRTPLCELPGHERKGLLTGPAPSCTALSDTRPPSATLAHCWPVAVRARVSAVHRSPSHQRSVLSSPGLGYQPDGLVAPFGLLAALLALTASSWRKSK